ncbi:hypothetical protein Golax_025775, partial [Gossypium laxum]|nr:hypothetical protein [Gossypium laxum]
SVDESLNNKTGTLSWDISTSWRKRWHFLDTNWTKINVERLFEDVETSLGVGIRQVEVETNNALLLEILDSGFACVNNIAEVRLLHTWIAKDWQVKLRLLLRDGNKVADCLAKEILRSLNQLIIIDEYLIHVQRLLETNVYHTTSDVIDEN